MVKVGVLCLQGDFPEHLDTLKRYGDVGVEGVCVRAAEELQECAALVLPGGESTTHGIVSAKSNLIEALKAFVKSGKPVWGSCAGLIALSDEICDLNGTALSQFSIGGLRVRTCRNYFGRQSRSAVLPIELSDQTLRESTFIRAPAIVAILDNQAVKVLGSVYLNKGDAVVVACEQGNILATAFHPELNPDDCYWHDLFITKVLKPKGLQGGPQRNPTISTRTPPETMLWHVKTAFPRMLQGGVIMDVVNGAQARIAEAAGACSVMALERIPADIRADGGIARMSDPALIKEVMASVSIPVMAKARIGHFGEARLLEALDVDCIDESEVLTPADEQFHINKHKFKVPFVCGAKDLGEALRRIAEGAAMIRLKGDAGTGNVKEAVSHARQTFGEIRRLQSMHEDELPAYAKNLQAPLLLVKETRRLGRLPVVTFAAGGIAIPADVVLMMELGCDGVFVGSGIFKGDNPQKRAEAMVQACTFYRDAHLVARVSENLGRAMSGILPPKL